MVAHTLPLAGRDRRHQNIQHPAAAVDLKIELPDHYVMLGSVLCEGESIGSDAVVLRTAAGTRFRVLAIVPPPDPRR